MKTLGQVVTLEQLSLKASKKSTSLSVCNRITAEVSRALSKFTIVQNIVVFDWFQMNSFTLTDRGQHIIDYTDRANKQASQLLGLDHADTKRTLSLRLLLTVKRTLVPYFLLSSKKETFSIVETLSFIWMRQNAKEYRIRRFIYSTQVSLPQLPNFPVHNMHAAVEATEPTRLMIPIHLEQTGDNNAL